MKRVDLNEMKELLGQMKDAQEIYDTATKFSEMLNGKPMPLVLGIATTFAAKIIHSASEDITAAQALALTHVVRMHDIIALLFTEEEEDDEDATLQ